MTSIGVCRAQATSCDARLLPPLLIFFSQYPIPFRGLSALSDIGDEFENVQATIGKNATSSRRSRCGRVPSFFAEAPGQGRLWQTTPGHSSPLYMPLVLGVRQTAWTARATAMLFTLLPRASKRRTQRYPSCCSAFVPAAGAPPLSFASLVVPCLTFPRPLLPSLLVARCLFFSPMSRVVCLSAPQYPPRPLCVAY